MKNLKLNKSLVFVTAWNYIKKGICANMSEALTQAWKEVKLRSLMTAGDVVIEFAKTDGEVTKRVAQQKTKWFKSENVNLVKFFSVTDNGFRACKIERVLSFELAA